MTGRLLSDSLCRKLQQGAVLVTANRRLARACIDDYQRRNVALGLSAWRTPAVLSWDAWLRKFYTDLLACSVVDRQLINAEQSLLLWQQQISAMPSLVLLGLQETAESARQAWQLAWAYHFRLDGGSAGEFMLNADHEAFLGWSRHYQQALDDAALVDEAMLPVVLAQVLENQNLSESNLLPSAIMMAGLHQPTPARDQLLDQLRAVGVGIEHVALGQGAQTDDVALPSGHAGAAPAFRLSCADAEQEWLFAARWARHRLQEGGPDASIGVVIPDLHLQRDAVLRLFDQVFYPAATPSEIERLGRSYDTSAGLSLAGMPPIRLALLLFRMLIEPLDQLEIPTLILSPYLRDAEEERDSRAVADARLKEAGCTELGLWVRPGEWSRLTPGLREILRSIRSVRDQFVQRSSSGGGARQSSQPPGDRPGSNWLNLKQLPSEWRQLLIDILATAGWPGRGIGSVEHQAIEAFKELIDGLSGVDAFEGPVNARRAVALVRQLAEGRAFQQEAGEVPVRILGVLESVGLPFDSLWVCGMDSESWPLRSPVSPYLPMAWQKSVDAPGARADFDVRLAEQRLIQWVVSATEMVFSHASSVAGNPVAPARQLEAISAPVEPDTLIPVGPGELTAVPDPAVLERLPDQQGPPLAEGSEVRGGARLFEDQARCPFRAFIRHRLGARALEQPGIGLDARIKGNLLHDAMQFFWQQTGSHAALVALEEPALIERIEQAVQQAIEAQSEEIELLDIERPRLNRLVYRWLTHHEIPRAPFVVESLEQSRVVSFGGLSLTLQVDRIDQLGSGGRAIIDYKTGQHNSTASWAEERITSAQLPLYAVLDDHIDAVCFAQTAHNQQKFIGQAVETNLIEGLKTPDYAESWPEALAQWEHALGVLAVEIREGLASVTPVKNACNYCDYVPVCRKTGLAELQAPEGAVFGAPTAGTEP